MISHRRHNDTLDSRRHRHPSLYRLVHRLRAPRYYQQQHPRRSFGLAPALLPLAHRAEAEPEPARERRLAQPQRLADDPHVDCGRQVPGVGRLAWATISAASSRLAICSSVMSIRLVAMVLSSRMPGMNIRHCRMMLQRCMVGVLAFAFVLIHGAGHAVRHTVL